MGEPKNMDDAREALGPIVERLLNSMMTAPAKLLGTGRVAVNDLIVDRQRKAY